MWNSDSGNHIFGWNVYQHTAGVWTLNIFNGGGSTHSFSDFAHNPLIPGAWYHMVITDDLTTMRFFVNGTLVGSAAQIATGFTPNGINGDVSVAGGPTVLGQRSDNAFDPFDGAIDDVAFYAYALTSEQIQGHYLNSVVLTALKSGENLVLSWPMGGLQQATNAAGPYSTIESASSPYTNAPTVSPTFYRVQLQ